MNEFEFSTATKTNKYSVGCCWLNGTVCIHNFNALRRHLNQKKNIRDDIEDSRRTQQSWHGYYVRCWAFVIKCHISQWSDQCCVYVCVWVRWFSFLNEIINGTLRIAVNTFTFATDCVLDRLIRRCWNWIWFSWLAPSPSNRAIASVAKIFHTFFFIVSVHVCAICSNLKWVTTSDIDNCAGIVCEVHAMWCH